MTTLTHEENAQETDSAFDFKAISGQIGIDKAQGIVEAFVSGIGNKDSVGDVVISGAFNGSLKRRKPRVVWVMTGISQSVKSQKYTKCQSPTHAYLKK